MKAAREVTERATQALKWAKAGGLSVLTIALDNLTLGRAHFALALTLQVPPHPNPLPRQPSSHDSSARRGRGGRREPAEDVGRAEEYLNRAVELLRQAGTDDHLPRGLLARAALRRVRADAQGARADLDEAEEIARRGRMRLHECDVHLERTRLDLVLGRPGAAGERLERARQLVEETGYRRRDEDVRELADVLREMPAESEPDASEDVPDVVEPKVSEKHVFLSYCRDADADAVRELHDDLVREEEPVRWDQDVLPGQNRRQTVRQAMKDAYAVVVCLSKDVATSDRSGVFPELRDAIDEYRQRTPGSIFLILARLDECAVPELEIGASTMLDGLEHVDLFPPSRRADGLKRLVWALRAAPGHP